MHNLHESSYDCISIQLFCCVDIESHALHENVFINMNMTLD